ncbi:MAG: NUDIX domain-containing protein [Acidimicrobiia bacterium]
MAKRSAGLLAYRRSADGGLEVLIAHPGGPLWAKRDDGVWTVPKGELDGDAPLAVAHREFEEELGIAPPAGDLLFLGEIRQKSGKWVEAWAVAGDDLGDVDEVHSNLFDLEWPPKSGRIQQFPEVDRALWADAATARRKLNPAQVPFVDRLLELLGD